LFDLGFHSGAFITVSHYGFFKLVEALLEIYSCFFSLSMKLYVVYRYQQCHCLAKLPDTISVFHSHMQDSLSVISNETTLNTKKTYF